MGGGLYLAVTLPKDKVVELGLEQVVPVWKKVATARCNPLGIFTKEVKTAPLQQEKDWDKSLFHPPSRDLTPEEKKLVFSLVIEEGLLAACENHLYSFHGQVRAQGRGLWIGTYLARAMARLVMLDWDQCFLELTRTNRQKIYMYGRYAEDTAKGMGAIPPGWRWSQEQQKMMSSRHWWRRTRRSRRTRGQCRRW